MTLGIWRWDGEVGIFYLAELYVHINDYEIERDTQVIRSDLFYSFALTQAFEVFLLFLPNFPVFTLSVIFSLKDSLTPCYKIQSTKIAIISITAFLVWLSCFLISHQWDWAWCRSNQVWYFWLFCSPVPHISVRLKKKTRLTPICRKNTPCYGCIFPHIQLVRPINCGTYTVVNGRKYTPVTGYILQFSKRKTLLWQEMT